MRACKQGYCIFTPEIRGLGAFSLERKATTIYFSPSGASCLSVNVYVSIFICYKIYLDIAFWMGFKTYVCTPAQAKIIQTLKVVGFKFGLSLGGFFICFCLVEVGGGFLCFWGFFYPNHGDFYNSWDGFCPLSWAAIMVCPLCQVKSVVKHLMWQVHTSKQTVDITTAKAWAQSLRAVVVFQQSLPASGKL